MTTGTALLSHGLHSGPGATKVSRLAAVVREAGWAAVSVDCAGVMDPAERVRRLRRAAEGAKRPLVLAGSSLGAWVSASASAGLAPAALYLLAPAFYMPGLPEPDPAPAARRTVMVHGRADRVVPAAHALRYAGRHPAVLHLVEDGHRLSGSLDFISALFRPLLDEASRADLG